MTENAGRGLPGLLRMSLDITGSTTYVWPIFLFQNKIYIQTDGARTTSLLGPTFAVNYMSELDNKHLLLSKPLYYRRYIDDILMISKDKMSTHNYRNKLTMKSMLDFTYEEAQDESF